MGRVKIELNQKTEVAKEQGREIAETGDKKVEEAQVSKQSLESLNYVDDDTESAAEKARTESDAIAKGIAESEIRQPGERVSESFRETSEQAKEHSETESENAQTATEMTGDYSDVGSGLSSEFQQSAQEFRSIADTADQENDSMKAELQQREESLEGMF